MQQLIKKNIHKDAINILYVSQYNPSELVNRYTEIYKKYFSQDEAQEKINLLLWSLMDPFNNIDEAVLSDEKADSQDLIKKSRAKIIVEQVVKGIYPGNDKEQKDFAKILGQYFMKTFCPNLGDGEFFDIHDRIIELAAFLSKTPAEFRNEVYIQCRMPSKYEPQPAAHPSDSETPLPEYINRPQSSFNDDKFDMKLVGHSFDEGKEP